MRNDQRQFFVFDLEVGARKAGATVPDMATVLAVWQSMQAAGQFHVLRAGTLTVLLGDVHVNVGQQTATLLIRVSDKMAPNSVYSDPTLGTFDEHAKAGNEGADHGCHVLLSTAPERNFPNVYTCAIERVVGLPVAVVQAVLSKFLKFEFDQNPNSFRYTHPGGGLDQAGQPRMDRCCPHIELRGRPSDTFVNDINTGRLMGLTLVKAEQVTPLAGAPFLRKRSSELELSIDRNNLPANVWLGIQQALRGQARNYSSAKISYKMPGMSRSVTIEIDTQTGNPLSDLYFESYEVNGIFPFLAQSAQTVVTHLVTPAMPQMIARRDI